MPTPPIPDLAPELAVEILSESNTASEIEQKLKEYFESGTQLAWFIDPRTRTCDVYHGPGKPSFTVDESGNLDGGDVLPGYHIPMAHLFQNVGRDVRP